MPDFILYAQHGWADNNRGIAKLAQSLATPHTLVITPNLGWVNTWFKMAPLIQKVETIAIATHQKYPHTPLRIIGHSMGGLIWLDILSRYPQWDVHSLVLIGAPVSGSRLAQILDPLNILVGGDLAKNRVKLAEAIAQKIKTLSIAGDINGKTDGTVSIASTKFNHSQSIVLKGISHPRLKNHPFVRQTISEFWANL